MHLPHTFQDRRFSEWNYLIRGLIEIWEMAHLLGLEEILEYHLRGDEDGILLERLGKIGNEYASLATAFHLSPEALSQQAEASILSLIDTHNNTFRCVEGEDRPVHPQHSSG